MPRIHLLIIFLSLVLSGNSTDYCKPEKNEEKCVHGTCQQIQNSSDSEPSCVCDKGWSGPECNSCGGRVSLDANKGGVIIDGYHNYSLDTKCSWLIKGHAGIPIRLRFEHFATECSWDHLYIYDGDSVFSPLVAVFSGLLLTEGVGHDKILPEISLSSGSAFLHFYSDAAYNMSGFKISYRIGVCPMDCSGTDHGTCNDDYTCTCHGDWMGVGCEIPMCPNNCSSQQCAPSGSTSNKVCQCDDNGVGLDCSIPSTNGHWSDVELSTQEDIPHGTSSHQSVLIDGHIWVVGGYDFSVQPHRPQPNQNIAKYDIQNNRWKTVEPVGITQPQRRYGHSLATYRGNIIMYGGIMGNTITDELWLYNITSNEWVPMDLNLIKHEHAHSAWRAVIGHTAHVIDGIMYIIFGHSPIYGYLNTVQECNMSTFVFRIYESTGALVKGGYGHVSVYDESSGRIFVHGGYHSGSAAEYHLSDSLYAYDPQKRFWTILRRSGTDFYPQYLHSAVISDSLMLVFAGNSHNDTSSSKGAKCYTASFKAYDIECDTWYELDAPRLDMDTARFGHSAEVYIQHDARYNRQTYRMYVFGGFNGQMNNDLILYEPGNCRSHVNKTACLSSRQGVKCAWVNANKCMQRSDAVIQWENKIISHFEPQVGECSATTVVDVTDMDKKECSRMTKCTNCLSTTYRCEWCADRKCRAEGLCKDHDKDAVHDIDTCYTDYPSDSSICSTLHNCMSCQSNATCIWHISDRKCEARKENEKTVKTSPCEASCYEHKSCENCTTKSCMWCSNQQRCVEPNAYVASFPYGQCMEWTTMSSRCSATRCEELRTCGACQESPACGWCDDGNNMGIGKCMLGGLSGPRLPDGQQAPAQCPQTRWYFADCPLCQCNGHSECTPGTSQCTSCVDYTTGPQCQQCSDGYYGNPTNGRNCSECDCNGQADVCDRESGTCFCHTKGVMGDKCDSCEEDHKYFGDPDSGGSCFYELATDFQYTFNLSKQEDHYYRNINFMAIPKNPGRDVEFSINCSYGALMNVTMRSNSGEQIMYEEIDCSYYKIKFSHKKYSYGKKANTTFYVYVYSFQTPFWLVISFSQFPQIDLLQFFVTFFSCFLSLLAIAAVLWKVKQRYDHYRALQRLKVEREQWANRPFAVQQIAFDSSTDSLLEHKQHPPDVTNNKNNKAKSKTKAQPSYIALEPMGVGGRAGVVSVLFKLPDGDEDHTPPGVSGISIGTSLVLLGNSHKALLEQPTKMEKLTQKQANKLNSNSCPENIV